LLDFDFVCFIFFTKPYDKGYYHMDLLVNQEQTLTRAQALSQRDESIWAGLAQISLLDAASHFINTLSGHTKRTYQTALDKIFHLFIDLKLFDPSNSLQIFSLSNLEFLLDEVRSKIEGSEATKQARAAAFIGLTRYLQRATGGIVRRVVPKREKNNPTFRKIRDTATTKAMNKAQWTIFLSALKRISFRDYLVAKTILQGAKRVSEVLFVRIEQINWASNQITFKQLKSSEVEKYTIITYPPSFIDELRDYVGDRKKGYIFLTRNGKHLSQPHLYRVFSAAGFQAGLSFTVHPHVLRASAITYLSANGFAADQILRVSGHADTKLVRYYDKTPIEHNPSRDVSLI
jgi:integrase